MFLKGSDEFEAMKCLQFDKITVVWQHVSCHVPFQGNQRSRSATEQQEADHVLKPESSDLTVVFVLTVPPCCLICSHVHLSVCPHLCLSVCFVCACVGQSWM